MGKGDKYKRKSSISKKRTKTLNRLRKTYLGIMWTMFTSIVIAAIYALAISNYIILFTSVIVGVILVMPYLFKWKYNLAIPWKLNLSF
jgi:hypothetical protein